MGNDAELNITYLDLHPPQLVSVVPKLVCDGSLTIDTAVSPGRDLHITVRDCDMDTSVTSADTVTVDVVSTSGTGSNKIVDSEQVVLTETALSSGCWAAFTGMIKTSAGHEGSSVTSSPSNQTMNASAVAQPNNAILYIATGLNETDGFQASGINVTYDDVFNSAGSRRTRFSLSMACSTAILNVSQTLSGVRGRPTSAGQVSFSDGVLDIQLYDEARNVNSLAPDSAQVTIESLDGADLEEVILTETSNNTNLFTGVIGVDGLATAFAPRDGSLGPFSSSDLIRLVYQDAVQGENRTVIASYVDPGAIFIDAPDEGVSIAEGEALTVTVRDSDLNTDARSVQVILALCSCLGRFSGLGFRSQAAGGRRCMLY